MFIFSSAKTESGSSYYNADAVSGTSNEYEMTSSNKDEFSSADAYEYDDIDELRAGYAELQSVKAQQQAISSDDAPEPPPPRPHEYLDLINES